MYRTVCKPDCPKRSATCHATCEVYLAEFNKNRKQNEQHIKDIDMDDAVSKVQWNGLKRWKK